MVGSGLLHEHIRRGGGGVGKDGMGVRVMVHWSPRRDPRVGQTTTEGRVVRENDNLGTFRGHR